MRNKKGKFSAALMAGILCFTVMTGYASASQADSSGKSGVSQEESKETAPNTEYDLPSMGMSAVIPDELAESMERGDVSMFWSEIGSEDGSMLQYGFLSWNIAAKEQQNAGEEEIQAGIIWEDTECVGMLGVYRSDMTGQLDELTGCDNHQEVGESSDGAYKYYISTNTRSDEELAAEISQIQVTVKEMEAFQQEDGFDTPGSGFSGTSLGEFTTQDINGETYTQDIFKEYDLTMVNVFATWCSPCVAEMPDLEELYQMMEDKGVNVIGVVLDVLDAEGEIVQEDLERAQLLAEKTGVTYPILIPDSTYMNGRLEGIEALPETFFVDKDGNLVGEVYSGSGSLEDWIAVVEKELANLEGEA